MTRDKMIEAARKALDDIAGKAGGCPGLTLLDYCDDTQCGCQETMVSALNAAFATIPGLSDVLDGKAVIVPVAALKKAAWDCRQACLVPPDGGAPTEEEAAVGERCARIVSSLIAASSYRKEPTT